MFAESVFFDANDLLQVKYEMLRSIQVEGHSIAGAAEEFGLSRPTVYEAQAHFKAGGLEGLLPEKRGPKQRHKWTREVMKALMQWSSEQPEMEASELAARVRRAMEGSRCIPARLRRPGWRGKKGAAQTMTARRQESCSDGWTERYEQLRQHALGERVAGWFFGLEVLLQNGDGHVDADCANKTM